MRAPTGRFLWEHLDEESVVYDTRSGQTHLLNALAVEAMLRLQAGDFSLRALAGELATLCETPANDAFRADLVALLRQLSDLGLVERVDGEH